MSSSLKRKIMKVSCDLANMNLKKSGKNSFLKFEYYELSDFLPQLYKLCLDNLLFLKVDIEKDKAVLTVKDCETEAEETFTHTFHFDIGQTSDKMDVMQREGCIATYMRRYVFMNAFGIVEPDGFDTSAYMKSYKSLTDQEKKAGRKKKEEYDDELPEFCDAIKSGVLEQVGSTVPQSTKNKISEIEELFPNSTKIPFEKSQSFLKAQDEIKYQKIAAEAGLKIDKLESNPSQNGCWSIYRFFSSNGIKKENKDCHPDIEAQYRRLNKIYASLKGGNDAREN